MTLFSNKLLLIFIVSIIPFQNAQPLRFRRTLADGGVLTDEDKQALLDKHNELRSETALGNTGSQPGATNMVEMIWDEEIAEGAKEYANQCIFAHDTSGFGENLYAAASSQDDVDNIDKLVSGVQNWHDEHEDYTYDDGSCGAVCGHYTQVVWAESTKLGCGYAECSDIFSSSFDFQVILVCRYDPPGNFIGQKPYEEASDSSEEASNCPFGTVSDGLGLCSTTSSDDDTNVDDTDDDDTGDVDDNNDDTDDNDDDVDDTGGGELNDEGKQALLDIHNDLRRETALGNTGSQPGATNMVEMIWDEEIAEGAKEYANQCIFAHDTSGFGENLYAAASSQDDVDNIDKLVSGVQNWHDEHEDYTYDDGSCGAVCGHYTQVVWAESTKLGCGYAECSDIFSSSFDFQVILVCRYDPPGNFIGQKPYEEASDSSEEASNCPFGTVSDGLGLCSTTSSDDDTNVDDTDDDNDDDDEDTNDTDDTDDDDDDDEDTNDDDTNDTDDDDDDDDDTVDTEELASALETLISFVLALCAF